MTPEELKNSILQLAIQGKLVEQRPEEGTAEELYQQIQAEKKRLIKEGKIKKGKPLPEITEDEIPFDIPESWKWVRFGEIGQLLNGTILKGPLYPYLEVGYLRRQKEARYLNSGSFISKGTRTILVDGQNSGEVFDIIEDGYMGSTLKVLFTVSSLYPRYVSYFLLFHKIHFRENKKGAAIPHLDKEIFFGMPFPIPPLAEQKRIVSRIEELLPYIDHYEQAWNELEELNKKFPDDLQKSILQLATQGKLVAQRPEEGTAEELYQQIQAEKQRLIKEGKIRKGKPLPEIMDDEIPFDIPKSWKWVRIGDAFSLQAGKNITASDIYETLSSEHPFLCYGGNGIRGYVSSSNRSGDYALIGRQGALCGNINFAKGDFYATEHAIVVDHHQICNALWCGFFLRALNLNQYATATAQPGLAVNTIVKLLIPIPPLAEQKRIVAKIEELLPLCEKLKWDG